MVTIAKDRTLIRGSESVLSTTAVSARIERRGWRIGLVIIARLGRQSFPPVFLPLIPGGSFRSGRGSCRLLCQVLFQILDEALGLRWQQAGFSERMHFNGRCLPVGQYLLEALGAHPRGI